jgi:hypothetical protein
MAFISSIPLIRRYFRIQGSNYITKAEKLLTAVHKAKNLSVDPYIQELKRIEHFLTDYIQERNDYIRTEQMELKGLFEIIEKH